MWYTNLRREASFRALPVSTAVNSNPMEDNSLHTVHLATYRERWKILETLLHEAQAAIDATI